MELSIDTASDLASIAVSREGVVVAEKSWRCHRNHTVEVLPAIDRLLTETGVTKGELRAVFVCIGPGMYTGLRVGISIGKGLARALGLPMVGVGRLEADAYPHRDFRGDLVAVHRAGRGDLAWAAYRDNPWREVLAPQLSKAEELAGAIAERTLFVGEVDDSLSDVLSRELGELAVSLPPSEAGRATALAALGHERLSSGGGDEPALIKPIYLRPPAIGPQGHGS
jgi:tRNA threonylcarbamoyladenosine biosynthesis protein TsaB